MDQWHFLLEKIPDQAVEDACPSELKQKLVTPRFETA